MTVSERVYQALLVAYPVDHRRMYGDPMVQLFRDRMRRDGGGRRTIQVWIVVGFDLLSSAFRERMETIMDTKNWTNRWWETSVVLLAVHGVAMGFLGASHDHLGWGIAIGFVPSALLIAGLAMRSSQRIGATIFLTVGSLAAAFAWWLIYTVVLAVVIVVGGFWTSKIGPKRTYPKAAVA
jgi:hypothetical protein